MTGYQDEYCYIVAKYSEVKCIEFQNTKPTKKCSRVKTISKDQLSCLPPELSTLNYSFRHTQSAVLHNYEALGPQRAFPSLGIARSYRIKIERSLFAVK
jgi:hypothetical protein